jgi:hypothetical protein
VPSTVDLECPTPPPGDQLLGAVTAPVEDNDDPGYDRPTADLGDGPVEGTERGADELLLVVDRHHDPDVQRFSPVPHAGGRGVEAVDRSQ